MNDRFIAWHMMYDRIAPDEPTSEPVMISARLPRVKPMPAAAQPEYEFSIDTTTGMSAPPIGMMIRPPSTSDARTISQNSALDSVPMNRAISRTRPAASSALMRWR